MVCRLRITGTERLNWSATCWASLKLRGMTRWTWTSEPPLPTGRSVRVRVAEIGSSSAKMSSISSRRARREVGRRRTGAGSRSRRPRRLPRSRSRARSRPRTRGRSRDPRRGRSRPALYARCRVGPWLPRVSAFGGRLLYGLCPQVSADSHEQRGAEADDRRPLLDRDPPVLRGAHREAAAARARRGQLGEAGEMGPRGLRVLAERAASSSGPPTRTGQRSMNSPSSAGATPPLPSSPATLTSTRTSVSGVAVAPELLQDRVGGDRVDQPAERQHLLHLAALQVADEVPLEGVAPALVLGGEVLLAVLADQASRRPRPARPSPRAARTWSRRGSRPPRRRPRATRSRLAAIFAGSRPWIRLGHRSAPALEPDEPAWRPVRPASRRWEKNSSASQLVQSPADSTRSTPASRSSRRATSARSSIRPAAIARRRAGRRRRAPRRRPRSSRGRSRGRSRRRSRPPPRRRAATIPAARPRQPQCSIATPPGRRGRPAGSRRRRPAAPGRLGDDVAVDLGELGAARLRRTGSGSCGPAWTASSAPWTWRPIGIRPGSRPSAAASRRAVLDHRVAVVVGEDAEVEAVEGRLADPAEPGREGRPGAAEARPPAIARRRSRATPSE